MKEPNKDMDSRTAREILREKTGLTVTDLDAVRMQTQISYVVDAMEAFAKQSVQLALKSVNEDAAKLMNKSTLAEFRQSILSLEQPILNKLGI